MNELVRRHYLSATSLKNYINDDPILDYFRWVGFKGESMNNFLQIMSDRGMVHENSVNQKIKDYCICNGITFEDLSSVKFSDRLEKTLDCLSRSVDVIIHGMVVSVNYPLYGTPDLIIKNKYVDVLNFNEDWTLDILNQKVNGDSSSDGPSSERKTSEDRYCIVEIKSCTLHTVDDHILNRNFRSHESQAYIYSLCLMDMIWYLNQEYYLPEAYIHVKRIWRSFTSDPSESRCSIRSRRMVEIDYGVHEDVMEGILWMKSIPESIVGYNIFPNPENHHDHPYRILKSIVALFIGDVAYLPGSSTAVRELMIRQGIYSMYDERFRVSELPIEERHRENVSKIIHANRNGKRYYRRVNLPRGIFMYMISKTSCIFMINGRIFKRIPSWCKYSIVYYYSEYSPRLPPRFTTINLMDVMEQNSIVMKGMINFSLESVAIGLYLNDITSLIYSHDHQDIHMIEKIYNYITGG